MVGGSEMDGIMQMGLINQKKIVGEKRVSIIITLLILASSP